MSANARRQFAVSSGLTADSLIGEAAFRFDFNTGTINELVSSTSVLTVNRPYEKHHINSSKRYARTAAGTVVYDHDSSGNNLGVLVEGFRTQGIKYSNRFAGSGGWEPPSLTFGGNTGAGGGGYLAGCTITGGYPGPLVGLENTSGLQASRLQLDTSFGGHYIGKAGLWTISTVMSYTIAVKGFGDTTNHAVRIGTAGAGSTGDEGIYITLNLQTGAVIDYRTTYTTQFDGLLRYPNVRRTSDGWLLVTFRVGGVGSGGGVSNVQPRVRIVQLQGGQAVQQFQGDGTSGVDIFGFQREYYQPMPSSYIHSDGPLTPITRPSDNLTWTLPSPLNANLRSVMIEVNGHVDSASLVTLDDGTASGSTFAGNYVDLQCQAGQYRVAMRRNSGAEFVANAGIGPSPVLTGAWFGGYNGPRSGMMPIRQRFVCSFSGVNVRALAGSGPSDGQVAHGLGGLPTISRIMIGQGNNGHLNVPIARFIGWTRELSGLEQLTLMAAR